MDGDRMLHLSTTQAIHLIGCCAAYRAYAWRTLPPSSERNQMMKTVQSVQGCVSQAVAIGGETLWLTISEEERQALRHTVCLLMRVTGNEASSEQRNQKLGELAGVRLLLERLGRQTQAL